jgi:hypothetical protein
MKIKANKKLLKNQLQKKSKPYFGGYEYSEESYHGKRTEMPRLRLYRRRLPPVRGKNRPALPLGRG